MPKHYDNETMLAELAPATQVLLDRHLETAEEWFPHEFVPWDQGQDFDKGEKWNPSESPLDATLRNVISDEVLDGHNAPHHYRALASLSPANHPLQAWAMQWAAEKGRHTIALQEWLCVTRAVDLRQLERDRVSAVSTYNEPVPPNIAEGLIILTNRTEKDCRRHEQLVQYLAEPAGKLILSAIVRDETRHKGFYRDLTAAAYEIDTESMVIASERQKRQRDTLRVTS